MESSQINLEPDASEKPHAGGKEEPTHSLKQRRKGRKKKKNILDYFHTGRVRPGTKGQAASKTMELLFQEGDNKLSHLTTSILGDSENKVDTIAD